MSIFDSIWNRDHVNAAATEGWQLTTVVDEGKPVSTAYLELFDLGPRFKDRQAATRHVMQQASTGSKLHIDALSARAASRMPKAAPKKAKR